MNSSLHEKGYNQLHAPTRLEKSSIMVAGDDSRVSENYTVPLQSRYLHVLTISAEAAVDILALSIQLS